MIVRSLSLTNFKNHAERYFEFSPQINCFVGNNGVGKTNVLDALHYLSLGKSFLPNSDVNNIGPDADFFSINALVERPEAEDRIQIAMPPANKKVIKKNDKAYTRLAEHIGYLPSVMISPYDQNLISDSGESRRRFLDTVLSQTDAVYLNDLILYQKTIQQRNALLKSFAKNRSFDAEMLEIYTEPLTRTAAEIHRKRKVFIEKLSPVVSHYYEVISGGNESVSLSYHSDLDDTDFAELLHETLQKDRALTYTSRGVHKDELRFEMNGNAIRKVGSQGQQKSFLVALKLAQMKQLQELTGKVPILLLDDIFDKLDDSRVLQLISLVRQENFGQLFITDTNRERTEMVVKTISEDSKIFEL